MKIVLAVMVLLLTGLSSLALSASDTADTQKSSDNKGVTPGDIGRGLKSAEQNIEKEIPKIGPAIGETFKKATGQDKSSDKSSDKQSSKPAPKDK